MEKKEEEKLVKALLGSIQDWGLTCDDEQISQGNGEGLEPS